MSEPAKNAKKTKSRGSQLMWTIRLEQAAVKAWGILRLMAGGLLSDDRPTRRMSFVFLCSLAGALIVLNVAWDRYRTYARLRAASAPVENDAARNMGQFFGKQKEEAQRRRTTALLGQFTLELKKLPGQKPTPGVLNMAELELVVECDERETCDFLENAMAQARNQVTNAFTAMDREELLTREGKKRLKKTVLDKLNLWLPRGKIENLYISRLFVS